MDNRYEIAEQNGMSREFADWFFDNKKAGCGNVWFMMMAAMWEGWQGRAAMLQGADGTLANESTITATQFKPVSVPDSLLSELLTIAKTAANAADECAHAEFGDDSMEHSKAIADWERRAAMLQGTIQDGNSPVIQDGWVMVPKEPTYQMCEAMGLPWESPRFPERYKAMIAAAPQHK